MKLNEFSSYDSAIDFLMYGLSKSGGNVFRGEAGLAKSKRFFAVAGNPHSNLRVIHIAGTSGKGTVAYMIEAILRAHGFSTGLGLSPHVYDIRERAQINGSLVTKSDFMSAINKILPAIIDRFIDAEAPTYFQVTTLLAFELMKRHKVDYAIVETGLGGLYDSSNVIDRKDKLCVLTRIGKDHTKILGNSYKAIARQKAGIIHKQNMTIALRQRDDVNSVFRKAAREAKSDIRLIDPSESIITNNELTNEQLHAGFQNENIGLAISAVQVIADRDKWVISKSKVMKALNGLRLPGRFEVFRSGGNTIVIDGAHNQQKISALIKHFQSKFPGRMATIVIALKKDKKANEIIPILKPIANEIVSTRFLNGQDMATLAHDPTKIKLLAEKNGIKAIAIEDAKQAYEYACKKSDLVLVTGSNYLIGEVHQLIGL